MIYTVTFNPSLDYIVAVDNMQLGMTNRTASEKLLPGGKGINVSTVLKNLGIDNTALGFTAGFTGEEIERELNELGVNCDFIKLSDGISRINIKLKSIDGMEINGQGPNIDENAVNELLGKIDKLSSGDILVLAGSIPNTMPSDIYSNIMERLSDRDILIVVDATGELLRKVLKFKPFLIKPNVHELGELFDVKITTHEEIAQYAKKLQEEGARNVLISMAGDGAMLVTEAGDVYESEAPKGKLVNGVGAGDSMVAGFTAGYLDKKNLEYAFAMGLSAGSASAFSENLATKDEIETVYKQLVDSNSIKKLL